MSRMWKNVGFTLHIGHECRAQRKGMETSEDDLNLEVWGICPGQSNYCMQQKEILESNVRYSFDAKKMWHVMCLVELTGTFDSLCWCVCKLSMSVCSNCMLCRDVQYSDLNRFETNELLMLFDCLPFSYSNNKT